MMRYTTYLLATLIIGAGFALPLTVAAPKACAEIAENSCDPDYMKSLRSRAWLEAEREIIQNQNLIFKADSVLEYTCFDKFVGHTAKHAGNLFVHNTSFGAVPINPRMEQALSNTVGQSLNPYLQSNFGHTFLGDRAGIDGAFSGIRPQNYTCNKMNLVWNAAKCRNFLETDLEKSTDGFFTFDELSVIPDPRAFPKDAPCGGPGRAAWNESMEIAANTGDVVYDYAVPLGDTYKIIKSFLGPGECKTIYTGVTVKPSGVSGSGYPDGACLNLGCTFQASGANGQCVKREQDRRQ